MSRACNRVKHQHRAAWKRCSWFSLDLIKWLCIRESWNVICMFPIFLVQRFPALAVYLHIHMNIIYIYRNYGFTLTDPLNTCEMKIAHFKFTVHECRIYNTQFLGINIYDTDKPYTRVRRFWRRTNVGRTMTEAWIWFFRFSYVFFVQRLLIFWSGISQATTGNWRSNVLTKRVPTYKHCIQVRIILFYLAFRYDCIGIIIGR